MQGVSAGGCPQWPLTKRATQQMRPRHLRDLEAILRPPQYVWEGTPKAGEKLVFTQVYYPHPPYRPSIHSNQAGAKANYSDELQATAGASGIQVARDDPEASVLCLEMSRGNVEWVLFNPGEGEIEIAGKQTKKAYEYLR